MRNNIFITGGMGFIGQNIVRKLAGEFGQIFIYDNLHPQIHGVNPSTTKLPANVTFIKGDVRDAESLKNALIVANPDYIIHLAAETGTGQSYDEISRYCDVNILGTANLIESIRKLENLPSRVLLASSRAIYGEGPYKSESNKIYTGLTRSAGRMRQGKFAIVDEQGIEMEALPASEETCPSPCSIYASTKLSQEEILELGLAPLEVPYSILRLQNVYGPGQSLNNPYTGVLSIMSRQILEGKTLNIYEDGQMIRDFVFIDDVVDAFISSLSTNSINNHKLNIGSGNPINILETTKMLLDFLGRDTDNYKVSGHFREGDIRHSISNIKKAQFELNWSPKVPVAEGLNQLSSWVKKEMANQA